MNTSNQTTETTNTKDIIITRSFNVPLQKVWNAWTDPAVFRQWWGPKAYTCPHVTIDFRVGGQALSCMRSKEGKEMWGINEYKELKRAERS